MADLVVGPAALRSTEVHAGEIPGLIDEIPLLAVLASRAEGETVFRDVGELRVKESDRLGLIADNIRAVGGQAEVRRDDLFVQGVEGRRGGGCEPRATTGSPWRSRCWAHCPAPGSRSTIRAARR